MRDAINDLAQNRIPEHVGLAYDMWAPISAEDGKIQTDKQSAWFGRLGSVKISEDYRAAFERWKQGFVTHKDAYMEVALRSRLLIGHGNPSPTEVGLTVHHTWGVPMISGSALKGLLNHYIQIVFGPSTCDTHSFDHAHPEPDRRDYQGVKWDGNSIKHGPGKIHRALFGAPEAESDEALRSAYPEFAEYIGASRGYICFHDALYVPGSAVDDKPFVKDILTVHQKTYYGSAGTQCPSDYDAPNPVTFLTARPKTRFFMAITGPPAWAALALDLLAEALDKWGIGGKTSSGYGRVEIVTNRPSTEEEQNASLMNSEPFIALSKTKSHELVGRIDGLVKNAEEAFAEQPQIRTEWARRALGRLCEARLEKKHKDKPWFKKLQAWTDGSSSEASE